MKTYTFDDVQPGTAWACRFRTRALVYPDGTIFDSRGLVPGQALPKSVTPGMYESLGVISVRDVENRKVIVKDTRSEFEFALDVDNTWDYDTVEFEQDAS